MSVNDSSVHEKAILAGAFIAFIAIAGAITIFSSPQTQGLATIDDVVNESVDDVVVFDVLAQDVSGLHGADISVEYDPSTTTFVYAEQGAFMNSDGAETFFSEEHVVAENGVVSGVYITRLGSEGVNGSGVIATFVFTTQSDAHGVGLGASTFVNSEIQEIPQEHISTSTNIIHVEQEPELEPDVFKPNNRREQVRVLSTATTLAQEIFPFTRQEFQTQQTTVQRITSMIWSTIVIVFAVAMVAVFSLNGRRRKNPEIVSLRKKEKKKR